MEGEKKLSVLSTLESSKFPSFNLNVLVSPNSHTRLIAVKKLRQACKEICFFKITNHGISKRVIADAIGSSWRNFFDPPIEEKNVFSSGDVYRPVRYSTIQSHSATEGGVLSREFMKLYAYPLQDYVD